jgi:hypothetical protein
MNVQNKPAVKNEASVRRRKSAPARMAAVLLLLVAMGSGGYALWRSVRTQVLEAPQFIVTPDTVTVTPPPPWIRSDVKAEVVRDINLAGPVSVLDEDVGERFYEAFAAHPWVGKVVRVLKRPPAGVQVDLLYRRPVLMVQVTEGLLPVDAEAVQLLTADFSPLEASRYPRLIDIGSATPPPAGTRWSDTRVRSAARLAAVLVDAWHELGLHHIALAPETAGLPANQFEFELFTKSGTRVSWGLAPDDKDDDRATATDKLARLRNYATEHGTLDGPRGPQNLDLRAPHGVQVSPRTAAKSGERR